MDDLGRQALIVFGAAVAGASASVFFVFRYAVRKILDKHFGRLDAQFAKQMEIQSEIAAKYLVQEAAVYPEISEIVYRAKTGADSIRGASCTGQILNQDLLVACKELTSQLTRYRIYLPEDVFKALHGYKHLLQDVLMIGDAFTRPEVGRRKELPEGTRKQVDALCDEISTRCNSILLRLRERLKGLQGSLAT